MARVQKKSKKTGKRKAGARGIRKVKRCAKYSVRGKKRVCRRYKRVRSHKKL